MLNRNDAPAFRPIDGLHIIQPEKHQLPNGISLFVINGGNEDLVRMEWIFDNAGFDLQKPLLNLAVSGMLLEGNRVYTAAQLAEKIDFYGAFLQPEFSADHTSLALYSLNRHLPQLLPLVKEVLTGSVFPQKELDTYIRNHKQKLQVSLRKNDFVARRTFNSYLFGRSPYGYVPLMEDYDQLAREDLLNTYHRNLISSNCTILLSGKVNDHMIERIRQIFGDEWPATTTTLEIEKPDLSVPTATLLYEERAGALQSAIRLGNQAIQRNHPDFPALQFVNTLLGGYFGSRLMTNIREDKGYTYGIGSGIASLKYAAFFTIATEVGVDVTAATLAEIEKEINALRTEPVKSDELELVRNYMLGSLLGSLENIFSHADKFKQLYFSGLDAGYYQRYSAVIKAMTAEDVHNIANKYLNYDRMVKVVIGKL
ncbi:Predicted Zn-dependent peptidase [bacterium A37T11]|nr:Predicted Zn-dependent peptidase [bacterium A37T11]